MSGALWKQSFTCDNKKHTWRHEQSEQQCSVCDAVAFSDILKAYFTQTGDQIALNQKYERH